MLKVPVCNGVFEELLLTVSLELTEFSIVQLTVLDKVGVNERVGVGSGVSDKVKVVVSLIDPVKVTAAVGEPVVVGVVLMLSVDEPELETSSVSVFVSET